MAFLLQTTLYKKKSSEKVKKKKNVIKIILHCSKRLARFGIPEFDWLLVIFAAGGN